MEKVSRIFEFPKGSFFLLGPRGTGKSTMIKEFFPDSLYLDLLLPDIYRTYISRPERLRELVHANADKKVIVIDEVQKAPELLDVVHSLMEEKRDRQFVLTGSSARKLKKTGADLLAGRAALKYMHPFVAAELKQQFNLEASLKYGMIPVVVDSDGPAAALQAYVDLYIREEVHMEGLTRNVGNFSRFLEAASFSHGCVLNVTNIARECEVERKVVEGYLHILEDLLLAVRIPVFTKRAKRATIQHPKFYFYDTGLYNALRPSGPIDKPEEIGGAALEGLVAQHLRAWIDYRKAGCALYFWRTSAGSEVDFIVYGKDVFWAVEVKNSAKIHSRDLRPLKAFAKDYPEAKEILIYRGRDRLLVDEVHVEPCEEFLLGLV